MSEMKIITDPELVFDNHRAGFRIEVNVGCGVSQWLEWPGNGSKDKILLGYKYDSPPFSASGEPTDDIGVEFVGRVSRNDIVKILKGLCDISFDFLDGKKEHEL